MRAVAVCAAIYSTQAFAQFSGPQSGSPTGIRAKIETRTRSLKIAPLNIENATPELREFMGENGAAPIYRVQLQGAVPDADQVSQFLVNGRAVPLEGSSGKFSLWIDVPSRFIVIKMVRKNAVSRREDREELALITDRWNLGTGNRLVGIDPNAKDPSEPVEVKSEPIKLPTSTKWRFEPELSVASRSVSIASRGDFSQTSLDAGVWIRKRFRPPTLEFVTLIRITGFALSRTDSVTLRETDLRTGMGYTRPVGTRWLLSGRGGGYFQIMGSSPLEASWKIFGPFVELSSTRLLPQQNLELRFRYQFLSSGDAGASLTQSNEWAGTLEYRRAMLVGKVTRIVRGFFEYSSTRIKTSVETIRQPVFRLGAGVEF